MLKIALISIAALGVAGCASRAAYTPPPVQPAAMNDATIAQSLDRVWPQAVRALASNGWIISSEDKATGLIVLNHAGGPEKYIDCGTIESDVTNPRAQLNRHYRFPGAAAHQAYEMVVRGNLYDAVRTMELRNTINVLMTRSAPKATRVTVNALYDVTRTVNLSNPPTGKFYAPMRDQVTFSSTSMAMLPGPGRATQCVATGQLEREVLSTITGTAGSR